MDEEDSNRKYRTALKAKNESHSAAAKFAGLTLFFAVCKVLQTFWKVRGDTYMYICMYVCTERERESNLFEKLIKNLKKSQLSKGNDLESQGERSNIKQNNFKKLKWNKQTKRNNEW